MSSKGSDAYGRYQTVAKRIIGPAFRFLFRIEVTGLEHLPTDGPAVLCANHLAAIDSFIVPAVINRKVIYVGKSEYLDDWKTRRLFPALGMIPIDRRGGDHAAGALQTARSVLDQGGLFAIYPEGTRSRNGLLHRGHTGAARLAVESGAPIIPIGLVGTDEIQPVNVSVPKFFTRAKVKIGAPIDVARYADRVGDHAVYRQLIDEVMFEIQALSGQEYVSHYVGAKPEVNETPAGDTVGSSSTVEASTSEVEREARRLSSDVLVTRPFLAA